MKIRQPKNNNLNIFLTFVAALILASWFVQLAAIEPYRSWEDNFILLLESDPSMNYQLVKMGVFCVILLIFLRPAGHRRKSKKYKLPKI